MLYRSTTQEPVMRSLSSRRSTSLQGIKMRSPCWSTQSSESGKPKSHPDCLRCRHWPR